MTCTFIREILRRDNVSLIEDHASLRRVSRSASHPKNVSSRLSGSPPLTENGIVSAGEMEYPGRYPRGYAYMYKGVQHPRERNSSLLLFRVSASVCAEMPRRYLGTPARSHKNGQVIISTRNQSRRNFFFFFFFRQGND